MAATDRHHDRACRPFLAGRRLSSGILGGRRPAQSVLHRAYPAQAPEAAQALRRSREGKRDRLRVGLRNRERAISEAAPARSPTRPPNASILRSEEQTSELQSLMRISYAVF